MHPFASFILSVFLLSAAQAQQLNNSQILGQFGEWTAYTFYNEENKKVCYALSEPVLQKYYSCPEEITLDGEVGEILEESCQEKEFSHLERDFTVSMITRYQTTQTDVPSIVPGYQFKPGSELIAQVDIRSREMTTFRLFTDDNIAWTYTVSEDQNLVQAIRLGREMRVYGVTSKEEYTADIYDLRGSLRAINELSESCEE